MMTMIYLILIPTTYWKMRLKYQKPPLFLHICCGPCATHVLEVLKESYHPKGFFFNPNLYPEEEYDKRLEAAGKLCRAKGIALLSPPYQPDLWLEAVHGREKDPEGGKRCEICIHYRLDATAAMAIQKGISSFGTTLTLSPHKNSFKINELGYNIAKERGVVYLAADFKKNNGFAHSVKISKAMNLYRQNYCGCCFSMKNQTSGSR